MADLIDKLLSLGASTATDKALEKAPSPPTGRAVGRAVDNILSTSLDPNIASAVGGLYAKAYNPALDYAREKVGDFVQDVAEQLGLLPTPIGSLGRSPLIDPGATLDTGLDPDAPFTFVTVGVSAGDLQVEKFRGREALSELYTFDIELAQSFDHMVDLEKQALGKPARLTVNGTEQARIVAGVVQSVRLFANPRRTGFVFYRVRVVPAVTLLGRTRMSRIFQDKSVREVVSAVLDHHGIAHAWRTTRTYRVREYCVQHQETDLHFVRRLLAEEGIYFFFEQPAQDDDSGREKLIFGDTQGGYPTIPGNATLPFRDAEGMAESEEFVGAFELHGALRTGATRLREFDFRHPSALRDGTSQLVSSPGGTAVEQKLLVYQHHEEYEGDDIDKPASAVLLEQLRRERVRAEGESWCPRLAPGLRFTLEDAPVAAFNAEYVVVRVEHTGVHAGAEDRAALGDGAARRVAYQNRFVCAPGDAPVRPKAVRRKVQQSVETAIVVGPLGEEIYTDQFARIKVQFHWDLDGHHNEHSSCWIRTSQNWSGEAWGFQFIPRIGMEVLVQFLAGDTDRPLVTGCVYNGEHNEPWALPEYKTISGIRTRSTLHGSGYNELSFEDLKGAEKVFVRAERDLEEKVLHDRARSVGRMETVRVGGNRTVEVGNDQATTVAHDRTVFVQHNDSTVVQQDQMVSVGGERRVEVSGAQRHEVAKDRSETVGGSFREQVAGNCGFQVGGSYGLVVAGLHRIEAQHGSYVAVDGRSTVSVTGDATRVVSGKETLSVRESVLASVAQGVAVDAQTATLTVRDAFTLVCGQSKVEVTPTKITVTSPELAFNAGKSMALAGGGTVGLAFTGDATITGKTVNVRSSGAKLELDSEARLKGAHVKLASGSGATASYKSQKDDPKSEKKDWVIQLFEPALEAGRAPVPLKNASVFARGHGPEEFSGTTDGGGTVKIPVVYPECLIVLTAADKYTFHIHAGGIRDDDGSAAGQTYAAVRRLHNLGYGTGDADAWDDSMRTAAVAHFQEATLPAEQGNGFNQHTRDALKSKTPG